MLSGSLKALFEQSPKLPVRFAINSTEHFDIFERQFEWSSLESNIPGRVRKHEAKIDVNEVAFTINKNIPVVTVFDLQEVCYD